VIMETRELSVYYGQKQALRSVSLDIRRQEVPA